MSENHEHPGMHEDEGLSYHARRSLAMQELLEERGVLSSEDIRRRVEIMDSRSPADGARVVARAWTDAGFKERLLSDARAATAELGYTLSPETDLAVLENTERVHHLVVCTLCSCYPLSLLGRPPDWYKSLPYRSRAVRDPRGVIREFGLELDDDVEVRVMDSTADLRYIVLPVRPKGTDGMTEDELAELVTRDSLIGVGAPLAPAALGR